MSNRLYTDKHKVDFDTVMKNLKRKEQGNYRHSFRHAGYFYYMTKGLRAYRYDYFVNKTVRISIDEYQMILKNSYNRKGI